MLESGALGRIYQIHARRLSPFPNRGAMLGASLDLATHDIDVMRHLTGSDVARVYAEVERRLPIDQPEDLLCATLRFEDDTTGLLEVNWLTPAKVRELSVTGEKGMMVVNYLTQELFHYEHPHAETTPWDALAAIRGPGEGNMTRYALQRREPLRVEWESFLHAVTTGTRPPVAGEDGLAAMSTARAIQRAGRDHVIAVPEYRTLTV
jgi:predicted dehydrogenase